ncbi:MAG: hypothetical protein ACRCUY_00780 [Thermoguttaceae bacterium]
MAARQTTAEQMPVFTRWLEMLVTRPTKPANLRWRLAKQPPNKCRCSHAGSKRW